MSPTLTRGAVTVTPVDLLGWRMLRPGASVVHTIIGDTEPEITSRAPGMRRGDLRLMFATAAAADAAADALAVPGAAWTLDVPEHGITRRVKITGDVSIEASGDAAPVGWLVTVAAQEVSA